MIKLERLTLGFFQSNCYILWDSESPECVIIDPGEEVKRIISIIELYKLKPVAILLTHCHIDHAAGVKELVERYSIPFYMHKEEVPIYKSMPEQGMWFGVFYSNPPEPENFLEDGQEIQFGNLKIKALHFPGHSPGLLCFLIEDMLFTGDLLFQGSIGRVDLPGGSEEKMYESLIKLRNFPENLRIFPGHGEETELGFELGNNPFLLNLGI